MSAPNPDQDPTLPPLAVDSKVSPSEVAGYLTSIATLLNGYIGHDYGLSKNAQAISILVSGLIVLGTLVVHLAKHQTASNANAMVYVAQLQHVASVVAAAPGDLGKLTAGVNALNGAITIDTDISPVAPIDPAQVPTVPDPSG